MDTSWTVAKRDASRECPHLAELATTDIAPAGVPAGCEDCLRIGGAWVHLRRCLNCGHIGCCDSSPHRHATAHARETGHPLVASAEQGEHWGWCYVDELMLVPA